jgi:7-cyano-7-deazaguanine synthase
LGPDGLTAFSDAMEIALGRRVEIEAPLIGTTKSDVIARGQALGFPWALSWSCVRAGDTHCGECDPCRRRQAAFRSNDVDDPTDYVTASHVLIG